MYNYIVIQRRILYKRQATEMHGDECLISFCNEKMRGSLLPKGS